MLGRNKKQPVVRLTGRQFREPSEPRELRSIATKARDRQAAKEYGSGLAHGIEMSDADGELHLDRQIDAEVGELIARTEVEYGRPIEAAQSVRDDALEEQEDAGREVATFEAEVADLKEKEASLGERHGPSTLGYTALMVFSFLMLLPADVGAARNLPLAPGLQTLVAVLLGGGMTWVAHYAGKKIEELREAHEDREQDRFRFAQERVLLALAIAVPVIVDVVTAIWRGQVFGVDARLTGGVSQGGAANVAFAVIGLLAFLTAVIASLAYRRMQPLREIRSETEEKSKQLKGWQLVADAAQRRERAGEVTIQWLNERLAHRMTQIQMWGERRKASIRRRGATHAMRESQRSGGMVAPGMRVGNLNATARLARVQTNRTR
jgi:hypothetical protein